MITIWLLLFSSSSSSGDSGGPIFQWIGDRWEQVGVVSYGEQGCATEGYPAVFTRISYFQEWIASYIQDNNQTIVIENPTINKPKLYQCDLYVNSAQCGCSRRNVILSLSTISRSENAIPYSWTMIVSIRIGTNNQHICSGTILDDSYILTAAHCLTNRSMQEITIEAGMYYRGEHDVIIRHVDHIYIHPNYTAQSNIYMNDIAMLHLSVPLNIDENPNTSPTCLPSMNSQLISTIRYPLNGMRVVITGWNIMTTTGSSTPLILQQAEIYVIDGEKINHFVPNNQDQHQFYAGRYENDTGNIIILIIYFVIYLVVLFLFLEVCYGGNINSLFFS